MRQALYAFIALSLSILPVAAQAQQDWWFDVEVILFDRGQSLTSLKEQFEYTPGLGEAQARWDLLSALFQPDISRLKQTLPICDKPDSPLWVKKRSLPFITGYRPTFDLDEVIKDSKRADNADALQPVQTSGLNARQNMESVSLAEAASLWLEFHGPAPQTIDVPDVRFCEPEQPWISWKDNQWTIYQPDNRLPYPDEMPIVPEGREDFDGTPHILPGDARELTKLSQQIRQTRGLTRLLHTTWRQPVAFGQDNAASVRLFAGKDYSDTFTEQGLAKTTFEILTPDADTLEANAKEQEDFFYALQKRLQNAQPVTFNQMMAAAQSGEEENRDTPANIISSGTAGPLWQIDGYLKVYLKNINRVPYLHIDSKLFYRQPIPVDAVKDADTQSEYELVAVSFHQMRRVISKQLHYFDHPLFGMVVKIRRFKTPESFK
ncbi:hypothetical protein HHX48_03800 [Salinimonas sp. HHU 13199]|uniref:Peptidoglycan-binding protein n=1 Tax=Salinimonas profundi TaxID=2729140 RepID=A0ABR8LLR8_9ALTE|nr:CsiV family protein [Salinimonas profundi]MBD3584859.1 hypothetical protein [Salinimonas profundi]